MSAHTHFSMRPSLRLTATSMLPRLLVFLVVAATAHAGPAPLTPEPADFALGFGGLALGFILWRNARRARAEPRE
jgi:hypothetical protein